jgi:hypothetical protein
LALRPLLGPLTSLRDEEVKMTSFSQRLTVSETSGQGFEAAGKRTSTRRSSAKSATLIARMLICAALVGAMSAQEAIAQVVVPGINAPPLVSFPSPPIQVPPIPQVGVLPQQNYEPLPQNTFSDRVSACVQRGGASGLTGATLDSYTSQCANQ